MFEDLASYIEFNAWKICVAIVVLGISLVVKNWIDRDAKAIADKAAVDKSARDARAVADKATADKAAADKADKDAKVIADKAAADKAARDARAIADKAIANKAAADKAAMDAKAIADKAVADKAARDRKAKLIADKAIANKAVADKAIADGASSMIEESYSVIRAMYMIKKKSRLDLTKALYNDIEKSHQNTDRTYINRMGFLNMSFLKVCMGPFLPTKNRSRTDIDVRAAVALWCSDSVECEARYGHISIWDTSRVTCMSDLFRYQTKFNTDISAWHVNNVTRMDRMFAHASSFDGDLSKWNVANVTNMSHMFHRATSFQGTGVATFNVSNVNDMSGMFSFASAFNSDLSSWNVSKCDKYLGVFHECTQLQNQLHRPVCWRE